MSHVICKFDHVDDRRYPIGSLIVRHVAT